MLLYGNGDESNFSFGMGRFIMVDGKKLISDHHTTFVNGMEFMVFHVSTLSE